MKRPKKRRFAAALLALLIVASAGAAAYTVVFSAGGGTTYEAPSGFEVSTDTTHGLDDANPFNDSDTVYISGVSFSASGPAELTVVQFQGSTTELRAIDTNGTTITADPDGKSAVDISGAVTDIEWEDAALDGTTQITYSASGSGTIVATGLPASTEFAAATTSGEVLTTGTTTSSGEASIPVTAASNEEIVLLDPTAPTVSNATPADGSQLTSRDQTFTIDAEDVDFATDAGDTINASLYVDGAYVGSDTLTANGTATVSATISTGGSHDYYWVAEDSYGQSTTSATRSISAPSELWIYNESAPTKLVDNATVELRMYTNETGDAQIFSRNTSDGSVNMTGLPADQPFIVVADADAYLPRRIFVKSMYETQSVYLLPDSAEYVETTFAIEDYSGAFPQDETVLVVGRELNGTYQPVLGDYFGANGQFPAQLAYNERHSLYLRNVETGEERPLGTFTPIASGPQTVTVSPTGTIQVSDVGPTITFPTAQRLPAMATVPFAVTVQENTRTITDWSVTIEYENDTDTTTLYTESATAGEEINTTLDLDELAGGTVTATVEYTFEDGTTRTVVRSYPVQEHLQNDNSLLASLTAFVDLAPQSNQDTMTTFLAMFLTVFLTGGIVWKVPMPTEMVGITAWGVLAVFGVLGWVPYDMLFVSGVAAVAFAYMGGVR